MLAEILLLSGPARKPYWRDEIASVVAASHSPSGLWDLLIHHTDASDGVYYFLLMPLIHLTQNAWWVRLPSVVAMALAIAVTITTARQVAGPAVAFIAGLLLVANETVLYWSTAARPYGVALLAVVLATHLFLRAEPGRRSRMAVGYGALVVAAVYLQAMAALVFLAHAVCLLVFRRFGAIRRPFLVALSVAAVACAPMALLMAQQSGQTTWAPLVRRPGQIVRAGEELLGGYSAQTKILALVVVVGVVAAAWRSRKRPDGLAPVLLVLVLVPPVALLMAGVALHIFDAHYLVFVLPSLAILAGSGLAGLPRPARSLSGVALVALAAVAVIGEMITPAAQDDPQGAAAFIAQNDRPGDVIVYSPAWARTEMYYFLTRRRDVQARDVAVRHGVSLSTYPDLYLPERSADDTRRELAVTSRVWVVGMANESWQPTPNTSAGVFRSLPAAHWPVRTTRFFGDLRVQLVTRPGA